MKHNEEMAEEGQRLGQKSQMNLSKCWFNNTNERIEVFLRENTMYFLRLKLQTGMT